MSNETNENENRRPVPPQGHPKRNPNISNKEQMTALVFAILFGGLGVHRFYTGYKLIGFLQIITAGGCGIWTLIDIISLIFNKFKTADNKQLAHYNKLASRTIFWYGVVIVLLVVLQLAMLGSQLQKFTMMPQY